MTKEDLEQELIRVIEELDAEEKQLITQWDAGGDQTPLYLEIRNKSEGFRPVTQFDDFLGESNSEFWDRWPQLAKELKNHLDFLLQLPGAGEVYSRGGGIFTVTPEGRVGCQLKEFRHYDEGYSFRLTKTGKWVDQWWDKEATFITLGKLMGSDVWPELGTIKLFFVGSMCLSSEATPILLEKELYGGKDHLEAIRLVQSRIESTLMDRLVGDEEHEMFGVNVQVSPSGWEITRLWISDEVIEKNHEERFEYLF